MHFVKTIADWAIEGVGGALTLIALGILIVDEESIFIDFLEVLLPLAVGVFVVAFGRWLHQYKSGTFDNRRRLIVAIGHLSGGVLFFGITGYLLFVISLESPLPVEIFNILLNGAAIGVLGNGLLTAAYLHVGGKQAELEAVNDQLEKQNTRLEKISSIVSHDIRSPLSVAQGRLELARETGDLEHLDPIEDSLVRIETIVADMLELMQQETNLSETQSVNLEQIVQSAWSSVVTEEVEVQVVDSIRFEADETRLKQAFENVFRNAIEHGGDTLSTIRVGTLDCEGFYIEDDGTGIPDSIRDELFEWGTTTTSAGTGLGLAIVNEIVTAHGWEITVASSSSGGARFEITGINVQNSAE